MCEPAGSDHSGGNLRRTTDGRHTSVVGPWSTAMGLSTKVVALSELTVYLIVF